MSRIKNSSVIIFSLLSVFMFMACRLQVPIREMAQAKKDITLAQNVMAEKYAPEEFNAAKTKLFESQSQVNDAKVDDAKASAIEADNLALNAYKRKALEIRHSAEYLDTLR